MKELKDACDGLYNVTATLPSSYCKFSLAPFCCCIRLIAETGYLKGFDVKGMSKYVDYFNFMSYDIHGTWDGNSEYTSSVVNPHTNLTEIREGLDLLWRNDIDPAMVLLGLGFYGRSFTLNDTSCTYPGCDFDKRYGSGGGAPGECTDTSGILTDYEINRVINRYKPDVVYNEQAAVNWFTWNTNQWYVPSSARNFKL
jgi:chitinase